MAGKARALRLVILPGTDNPTPPPLVCRWHVDSAGRLVCSWRSEESRCTIVPLDKLRARRRRAVSAHDARDGRLGV